MSGNQKKRREIYRRREKKGEKEEGKRREKGEKEKGEGERGFARRKNKGDPPIQPTLAARGGSRCRGANCFLVRPPDERKWSTTCMNSPRCKKMRGLFTIVVLT